MNYSCKRRRSMRHGLAVRTAMYGVLLFAFASMSSLPAVAQPQAQTAASGTAAAESVFVAGVRFSGNSVFTDAELQALISDRVGALLTFADLRAIAESVDAHYHRHGYRLARTVIPEQDFARADQTVELRVLEGTLGEVRIQGTERASEERVARLVHEHIGMRSGDVVDVQHLERSLANLNRTTDLQIRSTLQAGSATGSTDLIVIVEEPEFFSAYVETNNFGSVSTGRYRISPGFQLNGLSPRGDTLAFNAVLSPESSNLYAGQIHYRTPIGQGRTVVGAYVSGGNFDVGRELAVLEIEGRNRAWGVGMSRGLMSTLSSSLTLDAWLESRDLRQQMLGFTTSDDRIRKLRLGVTWDHSGGAGRTFVAANVHVGLGERLGAMEDDSLMSSRSFAGADNNFTRLSLDVTRVQPLTDRWLMLARLTGQHAFDSVVAGEQWAIGGAGSVRGHAQSVYSGDSGQTLMVEARYTILPGNERYQLVTFAEHGRVAVRTPLIGQPKSRDLTGAGVGMRAAIDRWQLRADVGVPVGRVKTDGSTVVNAQLMYRF